jgi:hypothetical protein
MKLEKLPSNPLFRDPGAQHDSTKRGDTWRLRFSRATG